MVDPADQLRVEADSGAEPEAAPVDAAQTDAAARSFGEAGGRLDRITREAERARGGDARAAARDEPERRLPCHGVQDLVVRAVAGEDVDHVNAAVGLTCERRRMAGRVRQHRLGLGRQGRLDGSEPLLADAARERVDDQIALTARLLSRAQADAIANRTKAVAVSTNKAVGLTRIVDCCVMYGKQLGEPSGEPSGRSTRNLMPGNDPRGRPAASDSRRPGRRPEALRERRVVPDQRDQDGQHERQRNTDHQSHQETDDRGNDHAATVGASRVRPVHPTPVEVHHGAR